ncbi:MAG: hypothetical protein IPH09_06540 [bacterium]|nr:hypothetical protein [bacterium]
MKCRPGQVIAAALALCWLLAAAGGAAQEASEDTTGTAAADSAAAAGGPALSELQRLLAEARAAAADTTLTGGTPYLLRWQRSTKASVRAQMQKVDWQGGLTNNFALRDMSTVGLSLETAHEDYRSQEKLVDRRNGSLTYATDPQRSLLGSLSLAQNWSRDEVTNSTGLTNANERDVRTANALVQRRDLGLLGALHNLDVRGTFTEQRAEQIGMRNDISEGQLDGALRTKVAAGDWLVVQTGLYGATQSGERSLGLQTNPSSTSGDTLRAGAYFDRGGWRGGFTVTSSNFDKRYLDYRRNANGIVDTIGAVEKIVQELESDDAVTLAWDNVVRVWGLNFGAKLARDMSQNGFRASGVGTRERHQDRAAFDLGFRPTRLDSVQFQYTYLWKWDDQRFKGATSSRGRQISQSRDFKFNWVHDLFRRTDLRLSFATGLSQEIAERMFNQNDRDRLETSLNLKTDTTFDNGFKVSLAFDARHLEDISIRRERSANNSLKDTYEVSPGYAWPVAPWLELAQNFRVWIQYSDYVYSGYEGIDKLDDYNKRGNLNTRVSIKVSSRLRVTLRHDFDVKSNAKKSRSDAAGRSFYSREQTQDNSKVDVSLTYKPTPWLTLDGTTYQARDFKQTFGASETETERFSGQVSVGGQIELANKDRSRTLKAGVHRFFAHGPSVQAYNSEYWDADIQVNWRF